MLVKRVTDFSEAISSCSYTLRDRLVQEGEALDFLSRLLTETREKNGIVYLVGNGGSAGIASHISADFIKTLKIPSQTLYDSNLMTCLANDLGYEHAFSYPLGRLLKPSDVLIAISSSGKSPNILNAARVARSLNAQVVTFTGFQSDNPLRKLGDLNVWINRSDYGLVETAHFFILHAVVDFLNNIIPAEACQYTQV